MTATRRFPKVSDTVDPQLKAALYGNLTDLWRSPEHVTPDEIQLKDAAVISDKVRKSSCFGAAVAVLAAVGAVIGLAAMFGAIQRPDNRPDYITDEMLEFLNQRRNTNGIYFLTLMDLEDTFPSLNSYQAADVLDYWWNQQSGAS